MFVAEALVFERDENGRPEAARGHDDAIFAKGLKELARRKILRDGLVELKSAVRPKLEFDPIDEY